MIYRFEKTYEEGWTIDIEADSFEEAKEILENDNPIWDPANGGENYLTSSRCLEYKDEDAIDEDEYEELEWEP